MGRAICGLCLLVLAGGAALPLHPAPERLQRWTTVLRDQQPDGPFVAVYRVGKQHLVFVGAQHEENDDSPTFRLIRSTFATFAFDTVIAEGFPTAWGTNPARIIDDSLKSVPGVDGFVEGGETVPAVLGAHEQGAAVLGGEAEDLDVKARVLADGISADDVLGFFVLRTLPQWIGERKITDAADARLPPLVTAALVRHRQRLDLPPDLLPDFAHWRQWYEAANGKPLGAGFATEEVGPLSDGPFATNRIAYSVSRARDAHLHTLIVARLNAGDNVLVVFGGSHLLIQRPALDVALGKPCYVGTDVKASVVLCR